MFYHNKMQLICPKLASSHIFHVIKNPYTIADNFKTGHEKVFNGKVLRRAKKDESREDGKNAKLELRQPSKKVLEVDM